MYCPKCDLSLTETEYGPVTIDKCNQCGGIWLDGGELQPLTESLIKSNSIPQKDIRLGQRVILTHKMNTPSIDCPRCHIPTRFTNYAYDSNIIIERCMRCEGIWLNKDEEIEIAKHIKGNPTLQRLGEAFAEDIKKHTPASTNPTHPYLAYRSIVPTLLGDSPANIFPLATIILIIANAFVYLFQYYFSNFPPDAITWIYGSIPQEIVNGSHIATLISSIFTHSDIFHLAGNLLYLYIFGDNVEEQLGTILFLLVYLMLGLTASVFSVLLNPTSIIPHIGASGAITGIMGLYLVLFPKNKLKVFFLGTIRDLDAFLFLGFWVLMQLINFLIVFGSDVGGVDYTAHLVGFTLGVSTAMIIKYQNRKKDVQTS